MTCNDALTWSSGIGLGFAMFGFLSGLGMLFYLLLKDK